MTGGLVDGGKTYLAAVGHLHALGLLQLLPHARITILQLV